MPPRKINKKNSSGTDISGAMKIFEQSALIIFGIMLGGLLFNLDRMGDCGIMLLKYKTFIPSYIVRFLPGGTAASGQAAPKQEISGQVIEVYDGDTVTVLTSNNIKYRIRFYAIDAPEAAQSFGTESRDALREKILGKNVSVKVVSVDQYQRAVGRVMIGSRDINLEMVQEGMAWYYSAYAPRQYDFFEAELNARKNRIGLWNGNKAVQPWIWRKENKK